MTDNAIPNQVFLRPATALDIPVLETLLNRCYLFEEGWTNESQLVGGIRTNQDELISVIDDDSQHLFVYPQTDNGQRDGAETGELLGCINVELQDNSAYIGFFAVNPDLQGSGVGSVMLTQVEVLAEDYLAKKSSHDKSIKMLVLNGRDKMLAYYQRRGYVCTGDTQSFSHDSSGKPINNNLYFIEIIKPL